MAQTKIIGGGIGAQVLQAGVEQAIDPLFLASRIAVKPLDYTSQGQLLGHFAVAQRSGEIAATLGALAHLARLRWAPSLSNTFLVLMRLKVGWTVSAAVTTATEFATRAIVARGFTVDFTTNMTAINLATVPRTNAMRATMNQSQLGTNGPGILTTAAMSGQTLTADSAPFAIASHSNPSTTLGAAAVTNQVGAGVPMTTLYEWTGLGQHPLVLSSNEGVLVQNVLAGPGSGTFALYTQWEWAEVAVF